MGPREFLRGAPTELSAILWRSGRLERASRSSNDSELQSITGAGNLVYKVRIIWSELNGRNAGLSLRYDSLVRGRRSAAACPAILAVDSRGGYDAIYGQESVQLGLKSSRAAIEAYALKQALECPKLQDCVAGFGLQPGRRLYKEEAGMPTWFGRVPHRWQMEAEVRPRVGNLNKACWQAGTQRDTS